MRHVFESFVNSERCKTIFDTSEEIKGLRALLIQKDAKRRYPSPRSTRV